MFRFLALVSILLFSGALNAQVQQVERYEIVQRSSDEDFTIIPLKEDGLALFRKKTKFTDRNRIWELILLDTTLNEKKALELQVDNQGELAGYEHSNGFVHFLFIKNEARGEMEIISIDLHSYVHQNIKIKSELKIILTHFNKCGDNFILGGEVGEEPAVFVYTPSTNNFKVIPGFFNKRTELVDIQVNENQTFNTILINRESRNDNKIIFRTFDHTGKQILEDIIPIDGHTIQTGISSNLKRDDLVILGTWGKQAARQSSGFYGVAINPFSDQKIEYKYLGELSHYLDHMKPKRAERIKTKTKLALEKGTDPDFSNYIVPQKIVEHDKGFVLLAETYIPARDYSNRTNPYVSTFNPYYYSRYGYYYPRSGMYNMNDSRIYGNNMSNDLEIKTVQSQVVLFSPTGEVVADYSINVEDVKIPSLNQVTDFYLDKDVLYFFYKNESDLIIKIINLEDNQVTELKQKVKTKDLAESVRHEGEDGRIRYWHGKSFYMYGYQSIRKPGEFTKDYFYINRVSID